MLSTTGRRLGGLAAGMAAAVLVTGCSASGGSQGGGSSAGRTLRAAFSGGTAETLNYFRGPTALDYVRARLVHAPLCELDPASPERVSYGVVESIEVADDLSEYTLRVRDGVRFTDGSELTSKDVLYSLRAPVELDGLPFTLLAARNFDLDAASAPDASTVVLPARSPVADGRELVCQSMLAIKDGTKEFTPETPSSGPFTIDAFEPGRTTLLKRNPGYYGTAPSLDSIELLSMPDGTARANALRQGRIDFAGGIAPAQAQTLDKAGGITVTASEPPYASYLHFTMNTEAEPFDDPRVREAFRLAVDRKRIVDNAYYGRAFVGNDLPALGFPSYDTALEQRPHDPERARRLLADAGADGMEVELTAGPELPGMVEAATLAVEDLKAVGVQATLRELPAGQLFADHAAYLKLPFRAGYNPPAMFEPNHVPGAFPKVDALVKTARSAPTAEKRLAASHRAQRLLWDEGGQIGAVFVPAVSAARDGVSGVRELQFPDLSQVTVTGRK